MDFFVEHIWEIIFGLIASGALGFCKYLHSQSKKYKTLLDEKDDENLRATIQDELEPIIEEIHRIETRLRACEENEKNHIDMLLTSYKFRLIQLCRTYLRQEYMTHDQFDQLTEFYKLYKGLGGNGQAKEYYEKACDLPIHDED